MLFSNSSCVLILPSNYCTPSPLMTPSSIPWRRFPVLDARLCQLKSFWWRLFSFFSFLVFLCGCGHLSKLQFRVREYADGGPKQCSACTIVLLRRSCSIACTRNRLSKQILKHSRRFSTFSSWEAGPLPKGHGSKSHSVKPLSGYSSCYYHWENCMFVTQKFQTYVQIMSYRMLSANNAKYLSGWWCILQTLPTCAFRLWTLPQTLLKPLGHNFWL